MLMRLASVAFVVLWSTGFIGSRLGASDAEPFTFLSIRFVLALAILVPLASALRHRARGWRERAHGMVVGTLIHGACLGGVFWAIGHGMPAGVAALIVSLQPIATSVLAGPVLGERVSIQHWLGLVLGLAGAFLILTPKLGAGVAAGPGITGATITATSLALGGITLGTLYQKRFATAIDLMAGTVWQYVGAMLVVGAGALMFETGVVSWTPKFMFALAWLVLLPSIGAVSLLMLLIRQNAVASVSGLFYLVPAVTAVIAYLMFGEAFDAIQLIGLLLATIAVLLTAGRRDSSTPLQQRSA
jgi:drug/metabolite transporter (DMT)-like permease